VKLPLFLTEVGRSVTATRLYGPPWGFCDVRNLSDTERFDP
jgi:hypothetical protein